MRVNTGDWEKAHKAKPGKDGESHFWRFRATSDRCDCTVECDGRWEEALNFALPVLQSRAGPEAEVRLVS